MVRVFKMTGDASRAAGQSKATILKVDWMPARDVSGAVRSHVGADCPLRGTVILITVSGEYGVPFVLVEHYGCARWSRLRDMVGVEVGIEYPAEDKKNAIQEELFKEAEGG